MRQRRGTMRALALVAVTIATSWTATALAAVRAEAPGPLSGGRIRLANGHRIAPPGRTIRVGDFPQDLCVTPDGRWAVVTHTNWGKSGFSVVDLARGERVEEVPLGSTWVGIAGLDGGRRIAVSGGLSNQVLLYDLVDGHARLADSVSIGPRWSAGGQYPQGHVIDYGPGAIWPTGMSVSPSGTRLFVVTRLDSALYTVDLPSRRVIARLALGAVPFTCLVSRSSDRVFVTCWDRGEVAVADTTGRAVRGRIKVGPHPTGLAEGPDGRLFVANAGHNSVSVVDAATMTVEEQLNVSPTPNAPAGSTPVALTIAPDGHRLVVAASDANLLAWFDLSKRRHTQPLGFMSAAAYPTAVAFVPSRRALLVANGKGEGSRPSDPPPDSGAWCKYPVYDTGQRGSLSLVSDPGPARLATSTRQVMRDLAASTATPRATRGPIPSRPGRRSPIRYVFYIFKENRAYDDMLGDMAEGDGDPARCMFGERVTPNHHALARHFVLLDRTFCDADGSADGHNWGMGAYSNDYVTRSVPVSPIYDYEGGNPLAYPQNGYLWDNCRRHGVSYRSYGEFVFNPDDPKDTVRAGVPALEGHTAPHYMGYDLKISDLDRYRAWLEEFDRYDRDGGLPRLSIIRLPNDHTEGTCSGRPTPRAHVAENDLALGMMVERISRSRYWRESAIFVIEDDAANGPDHVDAHRTVALLAGPYVRRGMVDHTFYTQASVLRTIQLILGLPPMSRFDAMATPMTAAFTATADAAPYVHVPARIDITETNVAGAYGQERCDRMNFAVADAIPGDALIEVLWRATHGAGAPVPPPARAQALAIARATSGPPPRDDDD